METVDLYELLQNRYGDSFDYHPDFLSEFIELVSNSGCQDLIVKLLIRRLDTIIQLGNLDYGLSWLEHLKNYNNMYSLHLDGNNKNYRILFSKKGKEKLLLHMFFEKSGKKVTAYAKHVPIAIARRDGN